jgi:hypothetical protein
MTHSNTNVSKSDDVLPILGYCYPYDRNLGIFVGTVREVIRQLIIHRMPDWKAIISCEVSTRSPTRSRKVDALCYLTSSSTLVHLELALSTLWMRLYTRTHSDKFFAVVCAPSTPNLTLDPTHSTNIHPTTTMPWRPFFQGFAPDAAGILLVTDERDAEDPVLMQQCWHAIGSCNNVINLNRRQ